ncbi:MAG: hypothetical protein LBV32_10765 [Tannerellaceae bacterium]|jgi:hypothetical protein|nr:hypothetical protein [Tannerellaceae bacterium]
MNRASCRSFFTLLLSSCILHLFPLSLPAQINETVYSSEYRIENGREGELLIEIDNLNFFKNNEFAGSFVAGYSLPGLWLQPKAVYYPLSNLKLELGIHALIYHGAYKYPNFAYLDIAHWKGNQFQKGAHLLPYLRAQADLTEHLTLVFGNIYGGANHRLIEPLYNPELNYTADPETGLQLLYDARRFQGDLWLNWQSFIFKTDTHQEAFTVGLSSRFKFNDPSSALHAYIPVQGVIQHRGGEIDTIRTGSVQTLMNGAAGLGVVWNTSRAVRKIGAEADVAGYYQQAGRIWPFGSGHGFYFKTFADIRDFRVKASYWQCDDFISMFGSPYFGAVSLKEKGLTFLSPRLIHFGAEYSRSLGKGFSLGVDLDIFHALPGNTKHPEKGLQPYTGATGFTAGAYLRFNPSFLIKQ